MRAVSGSQSPRLGTGLAPLASLGAGEKPRAKSVSLRLIPSRCEGRKSR